MPRLALFCSLLSAYCCPAFSQQYPQGYFRNPLNIPILLAGNFGECRPGHFHSGMDIKTGGHENEKVFAAADGYVSRIKMEPGGFGHGLYITHPNGYTTLYAHLNDFVPAIQKYVRAQQYAKESWTVDLQFTPQQFPVKKGEQIAWSGNTGGSTAPHLHFEIRDSKTEHPLNPQLFGFDIKDTKAPIPARLAIYSYSYDETKSYSLVNNNSNMPALSLKNTVYTPEHDTVFTKDAIVPIGIVCDDFMEGSENTLAFYTASWYKDDSLLGHIRLDNIGYDETRYVNAYADYSTKWHGGPWVQRLFRLKGNHLDNIYEHLNSANGSVILSDNRAHAIRIELSDVYGNKSVVRFLMQRSSESIGEQISAGLKTYYIGKAMKIESSNARVYFDENALYENLPLGISVFPDSRGISPDFRIGYEDVPVHHSFDLELKPFTLIPFALRSKVVMRYINGNSDRITGRAAIPEPEGWYKASVREMGTYRLAIDTTAPVLKPLQSIKGTMSKALRIAIRATDGTTSIKTFRGELDGKWILFEQHEDVWTYVFDAHCGKGSHRLVVKAVDENGNEAVASFSFTR